MTCCAHSLITSSKSVLVIWCIQVRWLASGSISQNLNPSFFSVAYVHVHMNVNRWQTMGLLPDTQNCGSRMRRECRERFPRNRIRRKPLVSDPGMLHGTCVTHMPWCMSRSLTRWRGKRSRHSGTCAIRNFTYLARGPWLVSPLVPVCDPNYWRCFILIIRWSNVLNSTSLKPTDAVTERIIGSGNGSSTASHQAIA